MDDSRTRLNLSSQTQDYAPNRRFLSTPKIGFLEEYQDVPYPHAAKLDPRSTKKPGCAHGWCGFMMEWWWEVFTWLIGSAAFITIVALLIVFGNQPLNHWRLPKIQITTTVAALAQTAVSALIVSVSSCIGQLKWVWFGRNRPLLDIQGFDDSSRGPAGSSLLLWNFLWKKRRPGFLVSLGALATILMSAFSTFAQQAVTIAPQNIQLNSSAASLPRATNYTKFFTGTSFYLQYGGTGAQSNEVPDGDYSSNDVDTYMLSAIKSGMLDSYRSLSNITGSCPTNQCSWKQHTTLAVCSSVEDISSTTVVFNKSVENFSISVQALKDLNRSPPIQPQIDRGVTFWMESLYLPSVTFKYNASSAETKANDKGLPNLAEVYVVYYPSCNGTLRLSGNESDAKSWRALKGTFKLCLQTLESNTTDGKTNTTIVNEWTDIFARVKDVEEDMYCAQIGQEPKSCAGANQWSNYGKQIAEIFNGSASLRQGGDNNIYAESALTLVLDVLGVDPTGCTSFSSTDGLKGFGMRLNNVATSMTNAMRTAPNTTSKPVIGTAWETKQFIKTDLRWLSLPAAVWLISTAVLFGTLWRTKDSGVPVWKSSPLVLLQCMFSNNGLGWRTEAEKQAEDSCVKLRQSGRGWQLVDRGTELDEE